MTRETKIFKTLRNDGIRHSVEIVSIKWMHVYNVYIRMMTQPSSAIDGCMIPKQRLPKETEKLPVSLTYSFERNYFSYSLFQDHT